MHISSYLYIPCLTGALGVWGKCRWIVAISSLLCVYFRVVSTLHWFFSYLDFGRFFAWGQVKQVNTKTRLWSRTVAHSRTFQTRASASNTVNNKCFLPVWTDGSRSWCGVDNLFVESRHVFLLFSANHPTVQRPGEMNHGATTAAKTNTYYRNLSRGARSIFKWASDMKMSGAHIRIVTARQVSRQRSFLMFSTEIEPSSHI